LLSSLETEERDLYLGHYGSSSTPFTRRAWIAVITVWKVFCKGAFSDLPQASTLFSTRMLKPRSSKNGQTFKLTMERRRSHGYQRISKMWTRSSFCTVHGGLLPVGSSGRWVTFQFYINLATMCFSSKWTFTVYSVLSLELSMTSNIALYVEFGII